MLSIQNVIAHLWREKVLFAFVISDDPLAPGDGEGERHDEDGWHGLHQRLKLGKLMTERYDCQTQWYDDVKLNSTDSETSRLSMPSRLSMLVREAVQKLFF